jgi:hypothetical protein
MPWSWVYDETGRLIHDHDVFVFIHHGQGNIFGEERRLTYRWDYQVEGLPRHKRSARSHDEAIHREVAFGDEPLDE